MFFKKKVACDHEYISADTYYSHELTMYLNGSDSIKLVSVQLCKKCSKIIDKVITEKHYPAGNDGSYELKRDYLKLLKSENIQTKEQYLINLMKELN